MAKGVGELKGVFCLETDQWSATRAARTVNRLCTSSSGIARFHINTGTWLPGRSSATSSKSTSARLQDDPILYLGFHGAGVDDHEDAFVETGDGTHVTLEQLEGWIDGRCRGRLIHFGACGSWTRTATG